MLSLIEGKQLQCTYHQFNTTSLAMGICSVSMKENNSNAHLISSTQQHHWQWAYAQFNTIISIAMK
jgi:hypothetical protein